MNSRFISILLALVTILGIAAVIFQKGWLTPYTYTAPPVSEVATSTFEIPAQSLIHVSSPTASSSVGGIITVKGEARGAWYFEGSFPLKVLDQNRNSIGAGVAHAEGEWMTANFVPFTASIDVTESKYHGSATLILLKDNPSGLPENDDSVSIPISIQ